MELPTSASDLDVARYARRHYVCADCGHESVETPEDPRAWGIWFCDDSGTYCGTCHFRRLNDDYVHLDSRDVVLPSGVQARLEILPATGPSTTVQITTDFGRWKVTFSDFELLAQDIPNNLADDRFVKLVWDALHPPTPWRLKLEAAGFKIVE